MRTPLALIAGLGLALAACGPMQTGSQGTSTPRPTSGSSIPSAGTGTISPIEGNNSQPPRPGQGVPTAGTGTISPIQGLDDQPPRPGRGVPSAGTGTISPVQGMDDAGPSVQGITRP